MSDFVFLICDVSWGRLYVLRVDHGLGAYLDQLEQPMTQFIFIILSISAAILWLMIPSVVIRSTAQVSSAAWTASYFKSCDVAIEPIFPFFFYLTSFVFTLFASCILSDVMRKKSRRQGYLPIPNGHTSTDGVSTDGDSTVVGAAARPDFGSDDDALGDSTEDEEVVYEDDAEGGWKAPALLVETMVPVLKPVGRKR